MSALAKGGLTFVNALGSISTVRVCGTRIAAIGRRPESGDVVIDVQGDRLLPGLINAHDHLQLNGLPRLKYRAPYEDVSEWIEDVKAHIENDVELKRKTQAPLEGRLLHGAIKNLLSGVTTVAHHDPLFEPLRASAYPIRVVSKYGWSHSLGIDGEENVQRSYASTPKNHPWIIHAAEGIGREASREFARLEALGCIERNTVLVHGIALTLAQQLKLVAAHAGLVWCPSSNLYLFERTADVEYLALQGHLALGSDSRMSGERDLLDEIRTAHEISGLNEATLEALVTKFAARLLRLNDCGQIKVGARADLLVMPRDTPLARASRTDVRLVLIGGRARYGDPAYAMQAAPRGDWAEIKLDGRTKFLRRELANRMRRMNIREPGLELVDSAWRAA